MATSEADRQRELAAAQSQKSSYESQKAAQEQKIEANKEKIKRLQEAKRALGDIKDSLEEAAKKQKKTAENEETYYEWSGEKKDGIMDHYAEVVPSEYTIYINRVDIVLDEIVAKETALENENLEAWGIIGQLGSWINSLIGKIEQLCN